MSTQIFFRAAGLLLHPSSLPGPDGHGALGPSARRFVDYLRSTGARLWQVLPLVPPGAGDSPYSSASAFAGNPMLIDLDDLVRDGLLEASELGIRDQGSSQLDFSRAHAIKRPLLLRAASRVPDEELLEFAARAPWADIYATFVAIRQAHGGAPYWTWPLALRRREATALSVAKAALRDEIRAELALQLLFDRQWSALRAYAAAAEVRLIGDMPIYVDADSADVWAAQDLFLLDEDGRAPFVSGVPPDAFSDSGQLWGNPLYRWDRMAADDFRWWAARLGRVFEQTDFVRIDHFRAFSAYWEIPAGSPDARQGRWVDGPGLSFFEALRRHLGHMAILAEDLGVIDDAVRHLLRAAGLPGMKVLQFAFGNDAENPYLPHHHSPEGVVYTGTHDNDTTAGYWRSAPEEVRDHVRRYFGVNGHDAVWDFIRAALGSVATFAIIPMQDLLGLGTEARMNRPSVASGNWSWRLTNDQLRDDVASRFRALVELYGRAGGQAALTRSPPRSPD